MVDRSPTERWEKLLAKLSGSAPEEQGLEGRPRRRASPRSTRRLRRRDRRPCLLPRDGGACTRPRCGEQYTPTRDNASTPVPAPVPPLRTGAGAAGDGRHQRHGVATGPSSTGRVLRVDRDVSPRDRATSEWIVPDTAFSKRTDLAAEFDVDRARREAGNSHADPASR